MSKAYMYHKNGTVKVPTSKEAGIAHKMAWDALKSSEDIPYHRIDNGRTSLREAHNNYSQAEGNRVDALKDFGRAHEYEYAYGKGHDMAHHGEGKTYGDK
jgi:hypothetical protein